jgi:hypothetical protein
MCPKESKSQPRTDHSAISKLVQDFGLLLIDDDFQRYLENNRLQQQALREGTISEFRSLDELHAERFIPLLSILGLERTEKNETLRYGEIIERLSTIESFVRVLTKTADFTLEIRELLKRLKRKFAGKNVLHLPYRTKRLISEEHVRNCRDIMWIVNEFHVPNEDDEYDFLWDVNIWTILLEADELHRKTGMVHFAFFERLKSYQESRGGGSPRVYRKAALAVLLAECFEDFNRYGLKAQINDRSTDTDHGLPKKEGYRKPSYTSTFADFLIKFCKIIEFDENLSGDNHSLDKYRKILRERIDQNIPRISERLASSLNAQEVSEILGILDQVKR